MKRVGECRTVGETEIEIDRALADLRQIQRTGPSNTLALASIEYRIGALREHKRGLETA